MNQRSGTAAPWVPAALMATMLVWGINIPLVKALTGWLDTATIAMLRMVVACATFGALALWRRQPWPSLSRRQWAGLAACAFFMVYVNQILFAAGMARTSAANGALIMATAPLVAALLAAVAFGERLHLRHLGAVALGFGGVAVVVLHRPGAALSAAGWGDLMVLGSVTSFAAGGVLVQRMSARLDPLSLSGVIYPVGTALLTLHWLVDHGGTIDTALLLPGWSPWALIVFSGVFATALGNWVWNGAIGTIGVARTAVYAYWVPVVGMGFAALLLGEPLNGWYALGLAMVLGGSRLAALRPVPAARVIE